MLKFKAPGIVVDREPLHDAFVRALNLDGKRMRRNRDGQISPNGRSLDARGTEPARAAAATPGRRQPHPITTRLASVA